MTDDSNRRSRALFTKAADSHPRHTTQSPRALQVINNPRLSLFGDQYNRKANKVGTASVINHALSSRPVHTPKSSNSNGNSQKRNHFPSVSAEGRVSTVRTKHTQSILPQAYTISCLPTSSNTVTTNTSVPVVKRGNSRYESYDLETSAATLPNNTNPEPIQRPLAIFSHLSKTLESTASKMITSDCKTSLAMAASRLKQNHRQKQGQFKSFQPPRTSTNPTTTEEEIKQLGKSVSFSDTLEVRLFDKYVISSPYIRSVSESNPAGTSTLYDISKKSTEDITVENSTIDMSCSWIKNPVDITDGAVPHHIVVRFMKQLEEKYGFELCRRFIRNEYCTGMRDKSCRHLHDYHWRNHVWSAIDKICNLVFPEEFQKREFARKQEDSSYVIRFYMFSGVKAGDSPKQDRFVASEVTATTDEDITTKQKSTSIDTITDATANLNATLNAAKKNPSNRQKRIKKSNKDGVRLQGESAVETFTILEPILRREVESSTEEPLSFPLNGSDWENDDKVQLWRWAKANLSLETTQKYLKYWLEQGRTSNWPWSKSGTRVEGALFQNFSLLPGEIRNQIWDYAIEDGIDVLVKQTHEYSIDDYKYGRKLICISATHRFLRINQESRSIVLPRYELTFGTYYGRPLTLFDYHRDTLFLVTQSPHDLCDTVENMLIARDRGRVTSLMLPLRDYLANWQDVCRALTRFPKLEQVRFAVGDGREEERYSQDQSLADGIRRNLTCLWIWRFKKTGRVPDLPRVGLHVIPATVAHDLKIDGIKWV